MSAENLNGNATLTQPADLRETRKLLGTQAKDLARTALEMEQLALLDDYPFEEALLLPAEEVPKRYTAENSKQIEWRRHACLKLLALQCPVEAIQDILHMNRRTVAALAAQSGQKLAAFSEQFAGELLASGASDLAFAQTKRDGANYQQLMIGAGIKFTHAQSLKLMSGGAGDTGTLLDVDSETDAERKFRAALAARKARLLPQEQTERTETVDV